MWASFQFLIGLAAGVVIGLFTAFSNVFPSALDPGWGSVLGGGLAAAPVGVAAWMGFAAQKRQMELDKLAENDKRNLRQSDLAKALRSEPEVSMFEIKVALAVIDRDIRAGKKLVIGMPWPTLPTQIYMNSLHEVVILPSLLVSNLIGVFHRLIWINSLRETKSDERVDLEKRRAILESQNEKCVILIELLKAYEEKRDGPFQVIDFALDPVEV